MADETLPLPANGNGYALKRDLALAYLLAFDMGAIIAALAASFIWKAEQWDLTTRVIEGLFVLANTLAGGLLVKTQAGK